MSTLFTPSRRSTLAGVFLFLALLVADISVAEEISDLCLTGISVPASERSDTSDKALKESEPVVHIKVQRWLDEQSWRKGYSLWQQSRDCRSALVSSNICTIAGALFPDEDKCDGAQDGYEFLVMHRYLLETMKALWPDMAEQLATKKKFPQPEDYPESIRRKVYAWPDNVLRAAAAVEAITKAKSAEVLQRWPTEGEFGRWLQCGEGKGLNVDALYGALLTNANDVSSSDVEANPHLLDLSLFWYAHHWIDQAWEKYRRATGKMPDEPQLQAALIRQCRVHQFWIKQHAPKSQSSKADRSLLYKDGELNPAYKGIARIMGEVLEIKVGKNGSIFIRIDPHLIGVNSLWVSSNTPLNNDSMTVGTRFYFLGTVIANQQIEAAADFTQSPNLLLAIAIQSIK